MNVEKLDMMIEDGIFEQAEIINHHIRQSEEAAKAGDRCGKQETRRRIRKAG